MLAFARARMPCSRFDNPEVAGGAAISRNCSCRMAPSPQRRAIAASELDILANGVRQQLTGHDVAQLGLAQLTHTSLLPADPDDVVGNLGARAERVEETSPPIR